MSYQVLARKWRPQTFQDMVGQEHVLQALIHALEHQRLHHAYLFTGTRGVGKTTIGRLLARCLNCETGITATPCGECTSCREIQEGRFVDLIEIDAASRTGVDDMRELTDNAQYSPTRGRFKVYLIDEVHMLSTPAFNAFLKTLEEPPEHVKFLLATTDPQKLPVTVLSRCLQFNLKRMTPEHIVSHLRHILKEEQVPFEEPALWLLARAADGSMRDGLSLTDQAIAFGNQTLTASDVSSMLGTIDQRDLEQLVAALVQNDGPALLAEIHRISDFAPDYAAILADLLSLFHRVTTEQVVPGSADNALGDAEQVQSLARQLSAEDAQLFYQIALMGRKDLAVTPDARMGFEMAMLRMLAFRPGSERREPPTPPVRSAAASGDDEPEPEPRAVETASGSASTVSAADSDTQQTPAPAAPVNAGERQDASPSLPEPEPEPEPEAESERVPAPEPSPPSLGQDNTGSGQQAINGNASPTPDYDPDELAALSEYDATLVADDANRSDAYEAPEPATDSAGQPADADPVAVETPRPGESGEPASVSGLVPADAVSPEPSDGSDFHWPSHFRSLGIVGMPGNLASQAAFRQDGERITLILDEGHYRLLNDRHRDKIQQALSTRFGSGVQLQVEQGEPGEDTPAAWEQRARLARQQAAEASIRSDPLVQSIVDRFEGRVVEESIRPL